MYTVIVLTSLCKYYVRQGFRCEQYFFVGFLRFYPEILQKQFIHIEILGEYCKFLIKDSHTELIHLYP